jgi:hypothetical protein
MDRCAFSMFEQLVNYLLFTSTLRLVSSVLTEYESKWAPVAMIGIYSVDSQNFKTFSLSELLYTY